MKLTTCTTQMQSRNRRTCLPIDSAFWATVRDVQSTPQQSMTLDLILAPRQREKLWEKELYYVNRMYVDN